MNLKRNTLSWLHWLIILHWTSAHPGQFVKGEIVKLKCLRTRFRWKKGLYISYLRPHLHYFQLLRVVLGGWYCVVMVYAYEVKDTLDLFGFLFSEGWDSYACFFFTMSGWSPNTKPSTNTQQESDPKYKLRFTHTVLSLLLFSLFFKPISVLCFLFIIILTKPYRQTL